MWEGGCTADLGWKSLGLSWLWSGNIWGNCSSFLRWELKEFVSFWDRISSFFAEISTGNYLEFGRYRTCFPVILAAKKRIFSGFSKPGGDKGYFPIKAWKNGWFRIENRNFFQGLYGERIWAFHGPFERDFEGVSWIFLGLMRWNSRRIWENFCWRRRSRRW